MGYNKTKKIIKRGKFKMNTKLNFMTEETKKKFKKLHLNIYIDGIYFDSLDCQGFDDFLKTIKNL